MPFANRGPTTDEATATAAALAAIVTPTIDEFEQAFANGSVDQLYCQQIIQPSSSNAIYQQQPPPQQQQQQQQQQYPNTLSGLESMIDAVLPYSSYYHSSQPPLPTQAFAEQAVSHALQYYNFGNAHHMQQPPMPMHMQPPLVHMQPPPPMSTQKITLYQEPTPPKVTDNDDVVQGASILYMLKTNANKSISIENSSDIVGMTVDILSDKKKKDEDENMDKDDIMEEEDEGKEEDDDYEEEDDAYSTLSTSDVIDSLVHPDRLAYKDDSDEVNKLHQYVRKDLLEIFVVPQVADSDEEASGDEEEDEEEDSDEENKKPVAKKKGAKSSGGGTRRLVTRRRSITVSTNPSSGNERHYPGRVGLRCVHCANIRRKTTSKAAFYPLRLKNIYREVCAWQRIHFKKCPHVPAGVRKRYDHYKKIDTSRGKVRYWETSARAIGLKNNPKRDEGVIFAKTACKS